METPTVAFAPKILSGIDTVDQYWGGMYRGGSYLLYGRASSGRGLLTLLHAQMGVILEETSVFISVRRPKDLMIEAASIGFNLWQAHEAGLVKLLRIPPMLNEQQVGDDGLEKAIQDLVKIISEHQPNRLVIDDFTPFIKFRSFERMKKAFIYMLEQIDSLDTTITLVMAEPNSTAAQRIVGFMQKQVTGSIHIEPMDDADPNSTLRRITLVPNIGHIRHKEIANWDLANLVVPEDASLGAPEPLVARPVIQRPAFTEEPTPALGQAQVEEAPQEPIALPEATLPPAEPAPAIDFELPDFGDEDDEMSFFENIWNDDETATEEAPAEPEAIIETTGETPVELPPAPVSIFEDDAPDEDVPPPAPAPSAGFTSRAIPLGRKAREADTVPPPAPEPTPAPAVAYTPPPAMPVAPAPEPMPAPVVPAMDPATLRADTSAPQPVPTPTPAGLNRLQHTDRDAFRARLQQHFHRRDVADTPFLLVAMRMDRSEGRTARPFDFEFILDLVNDSLRAQDDLLVDLERERLIVLLADSKPDEAQRFFARLKARLREEAPTQADHLLHSVSAIVVPDGRPFQNAEEFLTYALDED
ncbi:MAG: ATPase domain-containing protein [Bacteroidota bacterium]